MHRTGRMSIMAMTLLCMAVILALSSHAGIPRLAAQTDEDPLPETCLEILASQLYCPPPSLCVTDEDRELLPPCPAGSSLLCEGTCGTEDCRGQCCRCTEGEGDASSAELPARAVSSSARSLSRSSRRSSSARSAPRAPWMEEGVACAPFCPASSGDCTILCTRLPSVPTPDALLCPPGERLASFSCTLPGVPSCTYQCVSR